MTTPSAVRQLVRRPVVRAVLNRWPMVLALVITFDFWQAPVVPPAWTLLVVQAVYLFWGRRAPRVQLIVFGLYVALTAAVLLMAPFTYYGVGLIVFGWAAHAVWDLVHHIRNAVVPRWYSEFCGVFDLVIAVSILLVWPLP